jgi:hypothetical protein
LSIAPKAVSLWAKANNELTAIAESAISPAKANLSLVSCSRRSFMNNNQISAAIPSKKVTAAKICIIDRCMISSKACYSQVI